jgi:RNA polymerase sigma-70 factor (ECF subfamily)
VTAPAPASSVAAALADAHGAAVRAYFRRAAGADVADDLVQEVFLRVVRFADGFESRGRDRAWLFTIAQRVLIDHVRDASRRERPVAPAGDDGLDVAPLAVTPAMQELRLLLDRALHALEPLDRDAFLLAEMAGLSYAEIAAVLGSSHAAVRSRLFRARLALRAALAPSTRLTS